MSRHVHGCLIVGLALVAVQSAIGRDAAAVENVTLLADRTLLDARQSVRLRGSIDSGARGEQVEIEVKDCGQPSFRGVAGTTTGRGGEWSLDFYPGITTTIRASWKGAKSIQIPVSQRPSVSLRKKRSTGELEVWVFGKTHFWHKRVILQRRAGGSWKTVRQIVLTEQVAAASGTVWSGGVMTGATFRARLPRGTPIRAVLPIAEARPCYLAGVSDTERA